MPRVVTTTQPARTSFVSPLSRECLFEWVLCLSSALQACEHNKPDQGEALLKLASDRGPLAASIVSPTSRIPEITAYLASFSPVPGMLALNFFKASLRPRYWRPWVVVVSKGERIIGLVYCKELKIARFSTRIAFVDDTLGTMIVTRLQDRTTVVRSAIRVLLDNMLAVRFLMPSDQRSSLEFAESMADITDCPAERHAYLQLPRTYDRFLARLGPRTRRNFRYYRRRSEQNGNEFVPRLPFEEFCASARFLYSKGVFATSKADLERSLSMIGTMPSQLLVGLRRRDGEWMSLAGGWYIGDRAILLMQLNDRSYTVESVSLILRSYLLELLMNLGIKELVFWAGTSAPLSCYTTDRSDVMIYLDARSPSWRLARRFCAMLSKFGPVALRRRLSLISPDHHLLPLKCN